MRHVFVLLTSSLVVVAVSSFLLTTSLRPHQPHQHKLSFVTRSQRCSTHLKSSWHSHVSTLPDASSALQKLCDAAVPSKPDLVFLFVSQYHTSEFDSLVKKVSDAFDKECQIISVVAGGAIGAGVECDDTNKPSMSLLCGKDVKEVDLFAYNALQNPPPKPESAKWDRLKKDGGVLLFADPWSPMQAVLDALPSTVVAGGISVPTGTGSTVALNDAPLPQGSLVGVSFQSVQLQVTVAQGCRPVGDSYTITAAEGSVILELDSKPAIEVLETFLKSIASPEEQRVISSGLVCGISAATSTSTQQASPTNNNHMDYLVRQIVGFVPSKGGIVVAGGVSKGETFCFHVRDKQSAKQDLDLMMQRAKTERLFAPSPKAMPMAAMQFSCVARGSHLFGEANVDVTKVKELLDACGGGGENVNEIESDDDTVGGLPVGGFYANGEIGPVGLAGFSSEKGAGCETHLHGFTTVVAMLCDPAAEATEEEITREDVGEVADAWG